MDDVDALLPLPTGDPPLLLNMGRNLAYVASHGTDTVLARDGAGGLGLGGSWAGPAFAAASAEAQSGARLSHEVCDRVGPVVAAVNQYAGELTAARQTVEALREQWQAADRLLVETVHQPLPAGADPAAGLQLVQAANAHRERSRDELLTRHTACMRALEASEDRAAATVSAALGEAGSAGGQRQVILAQLPLTQGSARRAEVAALVDQSCAGLGPDPASWSPDDLVRVLGALAGSVEDPLVAQALMTRLGPSGVEHAARALGVQPGESGVPDAASSRDALRVLGLAFATSVSDAAVSDPVSDTVLDQWRPGWVQHLLEQPISSVTTQLALVAAAATGPRRILPGYTYAVEAARTLIARSGPLVHRYEQQLTTREGRPSLTLGSALDPYRLLLGTLERDPQLVRRVLLAPGTHGQSVLHDLVVDRPLAATGTSRPLTSSAALGELLGRLHVARGEPLATELLNSVGDAGLGWWALKGQDSINADRHLDPFRRPAAALLSGDPGRVWEAIRPFQHDPGPTARMQGVLGEIAKNTTAEASTLAAPALGSVLTSMAEHEADQFGQQVASAPGAAPNEPRHQAAQIRLGRVIGFTTESGTAALTHAAEQLDARNTSDRNQVRTVVDLANQLPVSKAPFGSAANVLLRPVEQVILGMFDDAHRVDYAERTAAGRSTSLEMGSRLAEACASTEVQTALGYDEAGRTVMSATLRGSVDDGAGQVNHTGPAPIAAR